MKILFITDNFPPEVNAPATRTYEHCVEWVKMGADVTVVTGAPNFPQGKVYPGYKNKIRQVEKIEGIRVIRVWTYMTRNEGFFRRTIDYLSFMIASFIAGIGVKTDIIIATSPQFFTAVSGSALSFVKRKPWIMEVRDLWPDSIIGVEAVKNRSLLGFFFWLEKKLYKSANLIIPVTETFKKEIEKKTIDPSKIKVIKNGSNLEMFKPCLPDTALKERLGLNDYFIVSYIGTHGMAHGLDFIINCASELQQYNIFFLFIGDGAKKTELVKLAEDKKVKNILFLDPIPKNQIPSYLSIADVSLIPLRKARIFTTVIPSKIFESAAMQKPILLGVEGESRDLIIQYGAGLAFEPENKMDFIEQLLKLKEDKKLYNDCMHGGSQLSIDYDRKKLAEQFYAFINEINS